MINKKIPKSTLIILGMRSLTLFGLSSAFQCYETDRLWRDAAIRIRSEQHHIECHTSPPWPITDAGTTTEDTTRHFIHTVLGVMRKTLRATIPQSSFGSALKWQCGQKCEFYHRLLTLMTFRSHMTWFCKTQKEDLFFICRGCTKRETILNLLMKVICLYHRLTQT